MGRMSHTSSVTGERNLSLLAACAIGLGIGLQPVSPGWLVTALGLTIGIAGLSVIAGWRAASLAVTLAIVPPGVVGENWGAVGLSALVAGCILFGTASAETANRPSGLHFSIALMAAESIAWGIAAATLFEGVDQRVAAVQALFYLGGAAILYSMAYRPTLLVRTLQALTWLVAIGCASCVVSLAIGFRGGIPLEMPYREAAVFFPPATLSVGLGRIWPEIPRFALLSGEPGLAAVFLIIALWYTATFERGLRRWFLFAVLVAGCFLTQSLGAFVAVVLLFGVAGILRLIHVIRSIGASISAVVAIVLSPILAVALLPNVPNVIDASRRLVQRARFEGLTLGASFRGFTIEQTDVSFSGGGASPDISLIAALPGHALIVIPLLALLAYLGMVTVRKPMSLGLVLAFAATALFAQPLQYSVGAWVLLIACCIIVDTAPVDQPLRSIQIAQGGRSVEPAPYGATLDPPGT
jgi:hypothetical protein